MNALQQFIASKPFGFVTAADMPELIKLDRLAPLLVRCGGCRFTCAAQYVEHLIKCVQAGGDYVRDVSFPVGSIERAANWKPCVDAVTREASAAAKPQPAPRPYSHQTPFNEADCGGVFDGHQVTSDADPGL